MRRYVSVSLVGLCLMVGSVGPAVDSNSLNPRFRSTRRNTQVQRAAIAM